MTQNERLTTKEEPMTFEQIREMFQENGRLIKETRESIKETGEQMKKTDRRIKEVSRQLGGMGNSNGAFAEDYFATALSKKKLFAGLKFDEVETNMKGKCGALKDEFDIVMYNGNTVAIIEVKYKVQTEDLETMAANKAANFRTLFPYYAGHRVYLGIGSMSFTDRIYAKAKELGIGVLKQNGDAIEVDTSFARAY